MNAAIERLRALMEPHILALVEAQFAEVIARRERPDGFRDVPGLWDDWRFMGSGQCRTIRATTPREAPEEHAEGYRHHAHIGRMPNPHDAVPGTPVGDRITATRHGKGQCRICQREYDKLTRTQTICGERQCRVALNTLTKQREIERKRDKNRDPISEMTCGERDYGVADCRFCGGTFTRRSATANNCGSAECRHQQRAVIQREHKARIKMPKDKCPHDRAFISSGSVPRADGTKRMKCPRCGIDERKVKHAGN